MNSNNEDPNYNAAYPAIRTDQSFRFGMGALQGSIGYYETTIRPDPLTTTTATKGNASIDPSDGYILD